MMRMTKTMPQNSKKCTFVNVSVVINSFFLDYGHNVSHLIFASCSVRDTYCSRHFNFAIFLYREINRSRKLHAIRYHAQVVSFSHDFIV